MNEDIFIVIRSIGERTEDACFLVRSQMPSDKNIVIKNKPFPIAHIESVENAIQSNARWALCWSRYSAKENAIESMISEAEKITSPFFQYNFRILDRGFCGKTYGVQLHTFKSLQSSDTYKVVV